MLSRLVLLFAKFSPCQKGSLQKSKGRIPAFRTLYAALLILAFLAISGPSATAQGLCPAVGGSSTCSVVITVTNTGASVSFTGEPPYDGIDDQLVGIINNSSLPLRSLELASSLPIFGFDGDGIDAFGIPGNVFDSTGYGGPNAYFTFTSDPTAGTVHFIVPISPNGGTGYFSLETVISSATACSDLINNALSGPTLSGLSLTFGSTDISATFTPNLNHSLSDAAQVCGFKDFDWIQKITHLPDPSPFFEVNPANPNAPIHLTSASTPFNDPARTGYTYNPFWVSYPFYWDANSSGHPWSLDRNKTANTLSAFDSPKNPCISGPLGLPSLAWLFHPDVRALCGNTITPRGSYMGFTTHLAGVNFDGTGVDLGVGYSWTSNFNGTTGGIATTASYLPADPGTGQGKVTVLNVQKLTTYKNIVITAQNGVPNGAVYDVCLQDDHSGDTLKFNSQSGAYVYTRCRDKFTLPGTGIVSNANGIISLSDSRSDRRISGAFILGQLTGRANIILTPAAGIYQTIVVNQTNPHPTCTCP
jgi:hypothetical protein